MHIKFKKKLPFIENIEKYSRARQATDNIIQPVRILCLLDRASSW